MSIVELVTQSVDNQCLSRRCSGGNCSIQMPREHQEWILLDMDSTSAPVSQTGQRCDYVFFGKVEGAADWAIPIELKEGGVDASKAALQLQTGADVAGKVLKSVGKDKVRFLPIVASSKLSRRENIELKKERNKVRFRDTRAVITRVRCKSKLADALK